jgi:hypothetical protein
MMIVTLIVVAAAVTATQQPASTGCAAVPEYQTLAAWSGDWDVKNPAGNAAGRSHVEPSPDGCGLIEKWQGLTPSGTGVVGTGLHAYDKTSKKWTHLWVDATGFTATLNGSVVDGRVVYERTTTQPGGTERHHRMTLAPSDGRVTQTGEHSDDGGKTWSRDFQLTYSRPVA